MNINKIKLAVLMALTIASHTATSAVIGEASVISHLGEPLRIEIPVSELGSSVTESSCFKVVGVDGIEAPKNTTVTYEPASGKVLISTLMAYDDIVVNFGLTESCSQEGGKMTKSFTLLLDPPSIKPTAQTQAPAAGEPLAVTSASDTPSRNESVETSSHGPSGLAITRNIGADPKVNARVNVNADPLATPGVLVHDDVLEVVKPAKTKKIAEPSVDKLPDEKKTTIKKNKKAEPEVAAATTGSDKVVLTGTKLDPDAGSSKELDDLVAKNNSLKDQLEKQEKYLASLEEKVAALKKLLSVQTEMTDAATALDQMKRAVSEVNSELVKAGNTPVTMGADQAAPAADTVAATPAVTKEIKKSKPVKIKPVEVAKAPVIEEDDSSTIFALLGGLFALLGGGYAFFRSRNKSGKGTPLAEGANDTINIDTEEPAFSPTLSQGVDKYDVEETILLSDADFLPAIEVQAAINKAVNSSVVEPTPAASVNLPAVEDSQFSYPDFNEAPAATEHHIDFNFDTQADDGLNADLSSLDADFGALETRAKTTLGEEPVAAPSGKFDLSSVNMGSEESVLHNNWDQEDPTRADTVHLEFSLDSIEVANDAEKK